MSSSSAQRVMISSGDAAAPAGACCNGMGNGKAAKGTSESEGVKGTASAGAPAFDGAVGGETTRECGCGWRRGWRGLCNVVVVSASSGRILRTWRPLYRSVQDENYTEMSTTCFGSSSGLGSFSLRLRGSKHGCRTRRPDQLQVASRTWLVSASVSRWNSRLVVTYNTPFSRI